MRKSAAFTLIEVLMAILISGFIMTGLISLVVMVINTQATIQQHPRFNEHIANVISFLDVAAGPSASAQIVWAERPGARGLDEEKLRFEADGELPVFVQNAATAGNVTAFLEWQNEHGLVLMWQSETMRAENEETFQRAVLSPLVTEIEYGYYDEEGETWRFEEGQRPEPDAAQLPEILRLKFTHPRGEARAVDWILPSTEAASAPL